MFFKYSWVWGLPQRMVDLPKGLPFKKTDSPSPSIYQMSVTSEPWMDFVSHAMRGFCVSYTGLEQAAMSSYMELPSYAPQTLFAIVSHHLWLLQSFHQVGYDVDVPFRAEHVTVSYFLDQSQVSVLITIYGQKKFLWWGLRDVLIYGYSGIIRGQGEGIFCFCFWNHFVPYKIYNIVLIVSHTLSIFQSFTSENTAQPFALCF